MNQPGNITFGPVVGPAQDPLNIANRLSKIVVPDADAAKREIERIKRNTEMNIDETGFKSAPKRHRQAAIDFAGPWSKKLGDLKAKAGTGMLVALIGNRGSGKTQLAVEVMRSIAEKGSRVLFVSCMELLMEFKASYRRDSDKTEAAVMLEFLKPKLLIIDEVARRGETDWENNLLFELINQRYGDMRDTILTCNLTKEELQGSMGPSIVSRMLETGGVMECNWESYRGKKNQ